MSWFERKGEDGRLGLGGNQWKRVKSMTITVRSAATSIRNLPPHCSAAGPKVTASVSLHHCHQTQQPYNPHSLLPGSYELKVELRGAAE